MRDGVRAGDKVLVVLGAAKLESLRAALGRHAKKVAFADMDEVGANPARIMPLWSAFVDDLAAGQGAHGVGEPITSAREAAELAECQLHESLLNLAFAGSPPFWLLCPYDTSVLSGAVLDEARSSRKHPIADSPASGRRALRTGRLVRRSLGPGSAGHAGERREFSCRRGEGRLVKATGSRHCRAVRLRRPRPPRISPSQSMRS